MPCMGPSKQVAFEEGEEIYEDVLKYLQNKYKILVDLPSSYDLKIIQENRKIVLNELKKAIQEIVWQDHCESF